MSHKLWLINYYVISACAPFGQVTFDGCCNTYIYRDGEKSSKFKCNQKGYFAWVVIIFYSNDIISFQSDQEYVFNGTFNGRGYFKNKGGLQITLQYQFCTPI